MVGGFDEPLLFRNCRALHFVVTYCLAKGLITFVYYQQQPVGLWIILQSPTIPLKVRTRKTRSRAF